MLRVTLTLCLARHDTTSPDRWALKEWKNSKSSASGSMAVATGCYNLNEHNVSLCTSYL
jgi:hypothetical protein